MADNTKNALVPYQEKQNALYQLLKRVEPEIAKAIPAEVQKVLSTERMIRLTLTLFRDTPKLQECSPESIVAALIKSAQLGLEPDGELGAGYLIPRWNKKKGCREAIFQRGMQGNLQLLYRTGLVKGSVQAHVVYEAEVKNGYFTWEEGLEPKLSHKPMVSREPRGDIVLAYARAELARCAAMPPDEEDALPF